LASTNLRELLLRIRQARDDDVLEAEAAKCGFERVHGIRNPVVGFQAFNEVERFPAIIHGGHRFVPAPCLPSQIAL
jgi:hypothetical protein